MTTAPIILRNGTQELYVPSKQIANYAVDVTGHKKISETTHKDHFPLLQRIAKVSSQHMLYAQFTPESTFTWNVIPYQKCYTTLGRIVQQLQVLWRIVFGGYNNKKQTEQTNEYAEKLSTDETKAQSNVKSDDAFCKDLTHQRQCVLTGQKVNVLFNYAPIGFGGEKLHFLLVPKAHRQGFSDVSQDEFNESMALAQGLVAHFSKTRKSITNVYLMAKTGVDAGQTVPHWHMHVIFSSSLTQDWLGKLRVAWNILFGSRPMSQAALQQRVQSLKAELAT